MRGYRRGWHVRETMDGHWLKKIQRELPETKISGLRRQSQLRSCVAFHTKDFGIARGWLCAHSKQGVRIDSGNAIHVTEHNLPVAGTMLDDYFFRLQIVANEFKTHAVLGKQTVDFVLSTVSGKSADHLSSTGRRNEDTQDK